MRSQLRHGFLKDALNWEQFGQILFERFSDRDLSFRACSELLGMPDHNTLYRACSGIPVSADTYLFLCKEFSIDPFAVFTAPVKPDIAEPVE
jgi:hypothetical protein